MHILLTDVLTCPRCGPDFGLIVLADRLEDRRVVRGRLGCANCREEYEVAGGVADLRFPPGAAGAGPADEPFADERAFRLAALLGVGDRPGTVLLSGYSAATAAEVARLLPAAQVVAEEGEGEAWPAADRVNPVRLGERIPFRGRSLRAAAVAGERFAAIADEVARALAPGGNLVLDPAPADAVEALRARGLNVLLDQEGVVVASPPPPR